MRAVWNDVEAVRTLAKIATWLGVIFALLAATSGVVRLVADSRGATLDQKRKMTPPLLRVGLRRLAHDTVRVIIESLNLIPFECQWQIVTRENIIVGGIPLDWTKVVPTAENRVFHADEKFQVDKVTENYLEVRLSYRSLFAGETRAPGMEGRLTESLLLGTENAPPS
jgi:hypothetical protein